MSRSEVYSYQLAAQLRQAMFDERVRATTETFLQRYEQRYEQMAQKGYEEYIPAEMNRLKADLREIRRLLVTNPTEAREVSRGVGSYINSMDNLGYTSIKAFEFQERIARQKLQEEMKNNKSEVLKIFYTALQGIADPIVRDFAKDELERLKNSIVAQNGKTDAELESFKASITRKVNAIVTKAKEEADQWKARKMAENQTQSHLEQLEKVEEDLKQETLENQEKVEELLGYIDTLKNSVANYQYEANDFSKALNKLTDRIDETVVSEQARREAVKAIIKSLKAQEFSVGKPQLLQGESGNYVKIVAKKPSGKQAECRIDLEGKIKYRFDYYEGMSCLQDIEKFNVDLETVYSIKLSDQRILWENPLRISKDSKPIGDDLSRRNR